MLQETIEEAGEFDYGWYDAAGLLTADVSNFVELRRVSVAERQHAEPQPAAQAVDAAHAPTTKPASAPPPGVSKMVPRAVAQQNMHGIGTATSLRRPVLCNQQRLPDKDWQGCFMCVPSLRGALYCIFLLFRGL